MKVTCIATGSSGNCFYVESEKGTGVFLDAGAQPKAIMNLGLSIANKPFLVTHEHGDHAGFAKTLANRYGAEILATEGTLKEIGLLDDFEWLGIKSIFPDWKLKVVTIPVIHNAAEPCGFYIELDGESLMYLVDAGQIPGGLVDFKPEALIIEANYTPKRLEMMAKQSDTELYVSGRVSSGFGHLSVNEAAEITRPMLSMLELLIFTHISNKNFDYKEYINDPEIPTVIKTKAEFAVPGITYTTIPF